MEEYSKFPIFIDNSLCNLLELDICLVYDISTRLADDTFE